jgi:mitogen-activated protein kinase kinase kinase
MKCSCQIILAEEKIGHNVDAIRMMFLLEERNPYRVPKRCVENECNGFALVLSLDPELQLEWTGPSFSVPDEAIELPNDLQPNHIRIVSSRSASVHDDRTRLIKYFSNNDEQLANAIEITRDQRAFFDTIYRGLSKIRKAIVHFADISIQSIPHVRAFTGSVGCVDLIENFFSFASDFGFRTAKFMGNSTSRLRLNRALINMAMDWVSFTCSDCSPTDKKTFRWAMLALEFVMLYVYRNGVVDGRITQANNILELSEAEFSLLRSKVACCMTLLISHFDLQHRPFGDSEDGDEDWSNFDNGNAEKFATADAAAEAKQKQEQRLQNILNVEAERTSKLMRERIVGYSFMSVS